MSGRTRCSPEANLTTVHSAVYHSQPALIVTRNQQTHTIDLLPYRLTCCQRIQMELYLLSISFMPMLQAGTSLSLLFSRFFLKYTVGVAINHKMFECEIHGKWSNIQANIHTHVQCNAVTLVWGLLRLDPITYSSLYNTHKPYSE